MAGKLRLCAAAVDILVATPGRLLDWLERREVHLGQVETFVLDEADRMLDMGFLPAIRTVLAAIPQKRQTLFFSATMPKDILELANRMLSSPSESRSLRSLLRPRKSSSGCTSSSALKRGPCSSSCWATAR